MCEKKKPHLLLNEVRFGILEDGLSIQILHIAHSDEPRSFAKMKEFISNNNLEIITLRHRDLYF